MYRSTLPLTSALDGTGPSPPRSGRFNPGKETPYPLYKRMAGPQDRPEQVRKISPPPGFDPRTAQTVASRYTDYTIPVPFVLAVIFARYLLWISLVTSAMLPEVLRGFPQSLKINYMKVDHSVHDPHPSHSFLAHHSPNWRCIRGCTVPCCGI
jgi:hypothetical protein